MEVEVEVEVEAAAWRGEVYIAALWRERDDDAQAAEFAGNWEVGCKTNEISQSIGTDERAVSLLQ
jgi:hypothetical protein